MTDDLPLEEKYVTRQRACELLGISLPTLHRLIRRGQLPKYETRAPFKVLIPRDALEKLRRPRAVPVPKIPRLAPTIEDRIRALGRTSAEARDIYGAAVCARALGEPWHHFDLTREERDHVDLMTPEEAREECLHVLRGGQRD